MFNGINIVLLTKGVAVEGTAILEREKRAFLERKLGKALVLRAQRLLFRPGISVVREARLALRHGEVRAMHDPTEGGLLSGLYELAQAGGVGLQIWRGRIPVLPETQALATALGFDPLGLIASGALLVVVSRRSVEATLRALRRNRILTALIGEVRGSEEGMQLEESDGRTSPLHVPARDEIARLLGG